MCWFDILMVPELHRREGREGGGGQSETGGRGDCVRDSNAVTTVE